MALQLQSCFINFTFCLPLLQEYNAFNDGNRTLVEKVENQFQNSQKNFYWFVSQKYGCNVTKHTTDACRYEICGEDLSYYDLTWYPEIAKGFLKNDAVETRKTKNGIIEKIFEWTNYTLTIEELDICMSVSLQQQHKKLYLLASKYNLQVQ